MLKEIQNRFGKYSLVELVLYPILALFVNPIRLLQSLWSSRVLVTKGASNFSHFNIHTGLNSFFYYTRALNLKRFGRAGTSPYLGLGNFNLARCFHYSLFSLFAYWRGSAVLLLICMFGWWASLSLFPQHVIYENHLVALGLILISTNFYANTFRYQNYNVVGWLFFPAFIFGLVNGYWIVSAIALLLATLGGFTVVFIGGIIACSIAVRDWTLWPLVASLPSAFKLSLHFLPFLKTGDTKKVIFSVMKAIGLNRGKARYKRKNKGKKLTIFEWYHIALIVQFVLVYYYINEALPFMMLIGLVILVVNSTVLRFADEQSIHMLLFTLCAIYALQNPMWLVLCSMWLAISPIPFLVGFDYDTRVLSRVPVMKPFDIRPFIKSMTQFLSPVKKDEKVFMAFADPRDIYENIYEGYRQLIELPSYVANQKEFLLFPEWWGVFELNYEGAPNIWGRSVEDVQANMDRWDSNYVIIYQESDSELDPKWANLGFKEMSSFDWNQFSEEFKNHKKFNNISFKWFLLKPNEQS